MAGLITSCHAGYTATKHAVVAISRTLRIEAERHGVAVSALCPGVIRTPSTASAQRVLLRRTG
jgi:NAD(P)-dependent dehydrogenase (short-subunit alcohol dehydrogenase family)